ncbi:hypothetical protein MKX36_17265 [Paenibacillus sp. FSL W8-0439]|uniref:hypothetical protein n=1 Tax=Paenibacillus sp. FSL W8-0439 TaxID=2921716 RepID=UPI0030FA984B
MANQMDIGAITLLDVLGWKGIWQRRIDAIDALEGLLNKAESKVKEHFNSGKENHLKTVDGLKVEFRSISDTIALVTYGEINKAIAYQSLINSYLVSLSIQAQIPLRGATSYGELRISNNIMVGPAVDEVASWYEMSDTIGVFLTPSALLQTDLNEIIFVPPTLVYDDVKIKGYPTYKTICINWVAVWGYILKLNRKDLVNQFLKMGPITPNIFSKYFNSLDFYDKHVVEVEGYIVSKEIATQKK